MHAQFVIGQRVKGKNSVWSSGQGHFSTIKNLDPGRSSVYGAYKSDPPLMNMAMQQAIYKSTIVLINSISKKACGR